ncbi:hypothetical protein SLE2022_025310 [Rubroshorea leprosula]
MIVSPDPKRSKNPTTKPEAPAAALDLVGEGVEGGGVVDRDGVVELDGGGGEEGEGVPLAETTLTASFMPPVQ